MDARDVPDHAAHDEKLDGPHGDRIIADRPVRPGETDPPAASASLDQTATKRKFRDWNHSKEGTIILGDVNEDGTIPPIDADSTELTAYAAHRLEIHRIIIPSANLAGTTIPTGVEVIGLGRIDELLNQGRPMRRTPWRATGSSGGPPPLHRPDSRQTCMD